MPDQHLADDPPADRAEPVAARRHVGLAEDVEPERRLVAPAVAREPDVGRVERLGADARATASPDGRPIAWPRCRSRAASER